MCGICGIFNFDRQAQVDPEILANMNRQILHRGPDEEGSFLDGNFGCAMRRLSILDVASGHQPVSNEDGSVVLVYNGEIYNHQELRAGLQSRGHRYRTRSDTETIVHLYEEYGTDLVQHLRGMFAFALWDKAKRKLFAARDRLGIKPFYYRLTPERLVFASEIKAMVEHPLVSPQLNHSAIPEYLAFGYLAGPETMFEKILKLPPGHTLEIDERGSATVRQYWEIPAGPPEPRPEQYYVSTYRQMLEDAVSSHLLSDVPLGMFLSGGLDSSAIAALMARSRREPIETFSVGYGEDRFSELGYAAQVARHIGSRHHEVRIGEQEFFEALPRLIWHEDGPMMGAASVPLYFVSRLARERVKVVLTGEGSDETLGGYSRYAWTLVNFRWGQRYQKWIPSPVRGAVRRALDAGYFGGPRLRRKLMHTFLGRDLEQQERVYFENFYAAFSVSEQASLLMPELQEHLDRAYISSMELFSGRTGDLLDRMLYCDIKSYLVELLKKQDTMSMAASVESRVPFLDHPLVEFAMGMPSAFKIDGLSGKRVLKKAVADLLPPAIINRQKMGFPTPFALWMAGPGIATVENLLLDPRTFSRNLFRREAVEQLFAEHRSRRAIHDVRFWRLLNLELWQRMFIDRDPEPLKTTSKMFRVLSDAGESEPWREKDVKAGRMGISRS
jgi:asparagine synthase (glutamine-hydrolysing)